MRAHSALAFGFFSMGLHHELTIYRSALDLLTKTVSINRNMPRDLKVTLGKSLLDGVSDFSRLIMHANIAVGAGKVPHLDELLAKLEVISFQYRGLAELGAVPRKHHADVIELVDTIGKQAGGWKRKAAGMEPPTDREITNAVSSPVQSSLML